MLFTKKTIIFFAMVDEEMTNHFLINEKTKRNFLKSVHCEHFSW